MSWLIIVWTSLSTVQISNADAAKLVYVDKTDVAEGILARESVSGIGCERRGRKLSICSCLVLAIIYYVSSLNRPKLGEVA